MSQVGFPSRGPFIGGQPARGPRAPARQPALQTACLGPLPCLFQPVSAQSVWSPTIPLPLSRAEVMTETEESRDGHCAAMKVAPRELHHRSKLPRCFCRVRQALRSSEVSPDKHLWPWLSGSQAGASPQAHRVVGSAPG